MTTAPGATASLSRPRGGRDWTTAPARIAPCRATAWATPAGRSIATGRRRRAPASERRGHDPPVAQLGVGQPLAPDRPRARRVGCASALRSSQVDRVWHRTGSDHTGRGRGRISLPRCQNATRTRPARGAPLRADRVGERPRRLRGHPLREGRRDRQDHDQPARAAQRLPPADPRRAPRRLHPGPRRPRRRLDHLHRRRRRGVLLRRRPEDPRRRRLHRLRRGRLRRGSAGSTSATCTSRSAAPRSRSSRRSPATRSAAATSSTSSAT